MGIFKTRVETSNNWLNLHYGVIAQKRRITNYLFGIKIYTRELEMNVQISDGEFKVTSKGTTPLIEAKELSKPIGFKSGI